MKNVHMSVTSTDSMNQAQQSLTRHSPQWFDDAFTNPVTKAPYAVPADLRRLSERLCRSYNIGGICDPMYIANIIALELGLGDGNHNFKAQS